MKRYDIFISYKNSDERGRLTEDARIARALYDRFTADGFSVFFSRETLKGLGASDYSAAIDEALESSSALVVVATQKNYAESRWVRYEWNNFHLEMLAGRGEARELFTVTSGVPAGDLPLVLRNMQNFPFEDPPDEICRYIENGITGTQTDEPLEKSPKTPEQVITATLARLGIYTKVFGSEEGPACVRYHLELPRKVTIKKMVSYAEDISIALGVRGAVMFANAEVGGITVEVPNARRSEQTGSREKRRRAEYNAPSIDLLDDRDPITPALKEEIERNGELLLDALARYDVEAELKNSFGGVTFARYDITIKSKTAIEEVLDYGDEIALLIRAKKINMYVNPDCGGLSVEIPNVNRPLLGLKTLVGSEEFRTAEGLSLAVGQCVDGTCRLVDLTRSGHLLIAGSAGSGKTTLLRSMILSLVMKYSPEELRFLLLFSREGEELKGLAHLLPNGFVTFHLSGDRATLSLNILQNEMERRYTEFRKQAMLGKAVRDLDEYNLAAEEPYPHIVAVIDDFGALAAEGVPGAVSELLQKARAAGIHLILVCDSRSSLSGKILADVGVRIGLRMRNKNESVCFLNSAGAEELLGGGDLLISDAEGCERAQGAYCDPEEAGRIVRFLKRRRAAPPGEGIKSFLDPAFQFPEGGLRVLASLVQKKKDTRISISTLQREFALGYNTAGRILEWLESMGYVSVMEDKGRRILLTKEAFEEKYGSCDLY